MDDKIIAQLLDLVKQNKKYKSISEDIIRKEIDNYLKKHIVKKITREDVKIIRSSLHKSYSSFQTKHKKKINIYLDELKENIDDESITKDLLSITLSTKERLSDYKSIYQQIFTITNYPKIMVDIGCGFNPFSFPLMFLNHLNLFAYDINTEDIVNLNHYFSIMKKRGLTGHAEILDLNDLNKVSQIPMSDVILLFKVVDLLDKTSHKPSEELIKILINKTKFIVVSFATKTLTRKNMSKPERLWFELMVKRLDLSFQYFKTDNEIFYILNKK